MKFDPPEIVDILKQQRSFHLRQLQLIDLALAAVEGKNVLRAGTPDKAELKDKKYRIQWTREIKHLFDQYNEFTIVDLQNDLAGQRGIHSARMPHGRNMITNALNRLEKKGLIQQSHPGVYKVVKEILSR